MPTPVRRDRDGEAKSKVQAHSRQPLAYFVNLKSLRHGANSLGAKQVHWTDMELWWLAFCVELTHRRLLGIAGRESHSWPTASSGSGKYVNDVHGLYYGEETTISPRKKGD